MGFLILNTKITPEFRQPKIIGRPALVKTLISNSDKSLICISAGAGYGKTTLVSEFLNTSKFPYSWYKIDNSDDNIFLFFSYIVHSIGIKEKSFGKNSLEIIDSLKSRTNLKTDLNSIINTIAGTFLNEFSKTISKNFYVVLDDFHLLPKDEWVSKAMLYLLENSPRNLHVVITTREKLPFDLASLKAKRKYLEVKTDDLRFREEDIKRLSGDVYEKTLDQEEITEINAKFEGWVTGLHLFLQSDEKADMGKISSKLPQNLYDFFAEDIYSSKSEHIQTFLTDTCILENFSPETCNYLLNLKDSENIINELMNGNVFIKRQEISQNGKITVFYTYQDLFKDFLVSKFSEIKTEDEKKEHYKKIAEYYILSNNDINSIKFLLLAEDYKKSVELILSNISTVIESGNLSLVNYWLNLLPENYKLTNPFVLYYLGIINRNYYGNREEALLCFNKAMNFLKPADKYYFIRTNTQIAEILIDLGKINEAKDNLGALLNKKLDDESKAYLLYWLAVCSNYESDYEKSLKLLHQSLDLAATKELKELQNDISNELGNIYLIRGDFIKSLFHYENAINHTKNIYYKFQTLTNIVQLYSHSGQYGKAKKTLDEAAEMQSLFPTPFFKLIYLLAETHLFYMIGDYEKTITVWNELLSLAKKSKISYYIYLSYLSLGFCHFYLKKYSKAAQYYEMAKEFIDELNETEKIDFGFSYAVLKKETKFSSGLEKDLKTAYEYFSRNGMTYNKVQAGLHLADFYLRKKGYNAAQKYLEESLAAISENEYVSYIQAEIFANRNIFDFAIENKIQIEFIFNIFSNAASLINYDWISEEYKIRLESDIEKLYDIKLECFGGIRIKKRGVPVDDEKWIRKIRKLIFTYIMLNHKRNMTKENIVDLFYPESTPENADSAFHQTLSNIRSVFKPENEAENPEIVPVYISYSDKIIQFNQYYFYYIDAFEFEKLYKKATGYGISEKEKIKYIKQAIEIYKGKFLEGYYQNWCEQLRERYIDMHLKLLDEILKIYKSRKDYKNILYFSEKLLLSDNLNEDAYLDIIESEVKLGNTSAAKKKYKLMLKTFKNELDESLSKNTLNKINSLLKV